MTRKRLVRARIVVAMGLLLAVQPLIAGQSPRALKLTNGQDRQVVDNFYETVASVDIIQTEFEATAVSVGKANPLAGELLDKLKTEDRALYEELRKITTSVRLTQGANTFYIRGLKSTNLARFRAGQARVKCRGYLLAIHSKDGVSYLPIIAGIEKL